MDDAATQQADAARPELEAFRLGAITKSGTSRGGKRNTKEETAKNVQKRRIICACGCDHPEGDMVSIRSSCEMMRTDSTSFNASFAKHGSIYTAMVS